MDHRWLAARVSACIVHHTDADREWAYDRDSHIGTLPAASTRPARVAGFSST